MNGVHDMGGMHGFGKVAPEPNEPVFHAPWEGRVLAMQRAMSYTGAWNIDMSRAAQETLPAHVYLGVSYYKRWALGMEQDLLARGVVQEDELVAGHALHPAKAVRRTMSASDVSTALTRGKYGREPQTPARFTKRAGVCGSRPYFPRVSAVLTSDADIVRRTALAGCSAWPATSSSSCTTPRASRSCSMPSAQRL